VHRDVRLPWRSQVGPSPDPDHELLADVHRDVRLSRRPEVETRRLEARGALAVGRVCQRAGDALDQCTVRHGDGIAARMMRSVSLAAFVLIATAFPGCATTATDEAASVSAALSSLPNQTAWAEGTRWSYETNFGGLHAWVYRPVGFSRRSPDHRALVVHLIGCGQRPYQLAQAGGWPKAAEAEGAVVVIPEIVAPSYPNLSAPNVACYDFGYDSKPTRSSPDHRAIIAAGTRIVQENPALAIDPRQVYLAGMSAGATVAMQIACMAPDVFAGVGAVAGTAIGTDQSRAVMPPSLSSSEIHDACEDYANTSPVADAWRDLQQQVYALVSDDNSLPVGLPVLDSQGHWTGTDFRNPAYWDGDKFVDFRHHELIIEAMERVFGARGGDSNVALPVTGTGIGCAGGEASSGTEQATRCKVKSARTRTWQARMDFWTDHQGRKRIVHVRQDTLRHRWPAGSQGPLDKPVSPSLADLVHEHYFDDDGFIDESLGNRAPNGKLGAIFIANDSFDFPSYFLDLMSANNPRL
jgi:poly(hydroxyalkanoate) depolymerase family esterase